SCWPCWPMRPVTGRGTRKASYPSSNSSKGAQRFCTRNCAEQRDEAGGALQGSSTTAIAPALRDAQATETMMFFLGDVLNKKIKRPAASEALPGRDRPIPTATDHFVSRRPLHGPYPEGLETAWFGMGCFWGAERLFWQTEGVWVTAVG